MQLMQYLTNNLVDFIFTLKISALILQINYWISKQKQIVIEKMTIMTKWLKEFKIENNIKK